MESQCSIQIDWDVPIKMDDGIVLRADVYRPKGEGHYPVIMSYGPYGKGLPFEVGYPQQWKMLMMEHPDVARGSTNRYQSWETADPEKWVPDGYVCARVDSRGCGRSPGRIDPYSARESLDYYLCIEWAASQPWSNGRIGLLGISYFAITQWQVASLQPPHLAAIIPWEGAVDFYRDMAHHGGILCTFRKNWFPKQVMTVQHGVGSRGKTNPNNGELIAGPETLSDADLEKNRADPGEDLLKHNLEDDYYLARTANLHSVTVPLLSCSNWGGLGLHSRGNFEGFVGAASSDKWLEVHGLEHWTEFYTDYGLSLQKKFFDHYLKGKENGWNAQPKVFLNVRKANGEFVQRGENDWPIPRTKWTRFFLSGGAQGPFLTKNPSTADGQIDYNSLGQGLTFLTDPLREEMEITGPSSSNMFVSSSTTDCDIFLVLRLFDLENKEVVFSGALDPHTPLAQGWLRASHRKLDLERSLPYRPYHKHNKIEPLEAGNVYELEIEVWPTSIIIPKGYRIGLSIRGKDYEYEGKGTTISTFANELRGCGPFLHNDPRDRPEEIFGGRTTIFFGEKCPSSILLPIIPAKA